jgi:peptide/nickel transport system ATP-binding protein
MTLLPPLLEVEGLDVSFHTPQGVVEAVRGVSFSVAPGEILAVVGESGSGKSVTARALVGLAGRHAAVTARRLRLSGRDGTALDLLRLDARTWRRVRGREIGFVLQDALVSLDPLRRVGQEVAEPILLHGVLPPHAAGAEVEALLARAGIPDPALRAAQYPHELSGGLRQRALIASALAAQPRLLIADEPTTALDVTIQKQILEVFAGLAAAGHGLLLITHDLAVAASLAHRVAVMRHGRIVEEGPAREVLRAPRHPYTIGLRAAVPSAAAAGRWLSRPGAAPRRPPPPPDARPVLELHDVAVRFPRPGPAGDFHALRGVSLQLRRGETLGIVGESGSGKTTLGKVALALRPPQDGVAWLDGGPWSVLAERDRRPLRHRIQTISQDPLGSFDPRYTVARLIEQPLRLRGDDAATRAARVRELLSLVRLDQALLPRRPDMLSGGQRQRVAIAQALATEPDILVCDEPVSALDVTTQAQVLDLLVELQARIGLAMLFISHDLGVVRHVSHRIAVMRNGEIVESGQAEAVFGNPRHPYTQELLTSIPTLPAGLRLAEAGSIAPASGNVTGNAS